MLVTSTPHLLGHPRDHPLVGHHHHHPRDHRQALAHQKIEKVNCNQRAEQEGDDNSLIESTTLVRFLDGSTLRLVPYDVSGGKKFFAAVSSHYVNAMPPSEVVKLAKHFLNHSPEWGNYDLKYNNCETFACFCKTGHMELAAQLNQVTRNVFSEMWKEPSCKTAEEALRKYRKE